MNKSDSEIWKTYPEFDFVQGSNLGRVRTVDRVVKTKNGMRLIKGHILKQQLDRYGYLFVSFRVNGKKVNRKVHRIIAQTFLPNPNELPQVNHIDCDRTNNNVDKLEWCTHEYNMQYKEKYGTSAAEALGCPVYAVNLETLEVSKFPSQLEASRALGIVGQNISAVIKGKLKTAGGYWFTEDESEITKDKLQEIKSNMLFRGGAIAIDVEEQEPLYFESQREAARRLGFGLSNVSEVIAGRQKTAHGYWFVRADSSAVEKTKAKFGDEVARKVEQLMSEKDYN